MTSITTAKSQVMAVCCAALVVHRTTPATGVHPCPTMTEWARSPALVRQWAEDWVLSPLWDAVFRLPIDGTTSASQQHFLFVSVSLTLGVLSHSCFTCGINCGVCGCIGDNKVLMYVPKRRYDRDGPAAGDHVIRDTAAAPWNQQSVSVPEVSLAQWEQVRFTACNRKWIVGCQIKGSVLYIHRVVRGSPVGDDVILKCRDFSWGFEPQFTPLGGDVVMLRGLGETMNAPRVFVDLWESFNKKELVVTSKILYRTNWPLVATGVTWLPDGSACILQSYHTAIADGEKNDTAFYLVDQGSNATVWEFPEKDVTVLGKNHLLHSPSLWWSADSFKVLHTGLILSTTHRIEYEEEATGALCTTTEIEFSLHDGVTGFHIGVFTHPLQNNLKFTPF
ncbi:hypothetical protein Pelo_18067 [Pelomyxa schiedti]|nr:hypothetical protein Pelo_18067 [Pelomyxa schiedti]